MRVIPSKVHGVIDYMTGILLIAAPWLFGFAESETATRVTIGIGVVLLVLSVLTRYELGLIKVIPLKVHLVMDILAGLLLAASPWLFGFSDVVYLPHLIVGLGEVVVAALTQNRPHSHLATAEPAHH